MQLIRKARRFFPLGSAADIWAEFKHGLRNTKQEVAFQSLGWLALLMPTHVSRQLEGDWNVWVREWLHLWSTVIHSTYWDCLWMSLFARLIKHDTVGAVHWKEHLDVLFTHFLWGFEVPIGTSSSSIPVSSLAPQECETLFGRECTPCSTSSAKAIVYLLGHGDPVGPSWLPISLATEHALTGTTTCKQLADLENEELVGGRLDRLIDLLEQFFHPSNGGGWTGSLCGFLRHLVDHFMRRRVIESSLAQTQPSKKLCNTAALRSCLSDSQSRRFVLAVVRLASRAQYSKDSRMMETSCGG